jgi:hypothetical protein
MVKACLFCLSIYWYLDIVMSERWGKERMVAELEVSVVMPVKIRQESFRRKDL